jgi:MFS family permease
MRYQNIILLALILISAMTVLLAGPVISFFIPVMHAELGIPLFYFGLAMSARQLAFAFASPFLGRGIDRFGARPLLLLVSIIAGVTVFSLSFVESRWHLVLLIGLLGLIGLQGAGGELYGSVVVAKWFKQNRGRAMSIIFLGMPVGIFFFTPLTQYVIAEFGWQFAWQAFGISGACLMFFGSILLRSAPSESDCSESVDAAFTSRQPIQAGHQWTRSQAVRTSAFWKVSISFGILMFTISTVAMFRVPHFIDQGLSAEWVAVAFSAEALISAMVAIPVGMLIDRYPIRYLTAIGYSFAITMLLLTIYTDTKIELFIATASFGLGAASVIIIQNAIWPAYFGTENIGSVRGLAMPVTLIFATLGAPAAGWIRDTTGSFEPIWWFGICAMIISILLILSAKPPVLKVDEQFF